MASILESPLSTPMTWEAETLLSNDGLVELEATHLEEIGAAAEILKDNPLPVEVLRPEHVKMPACASLMKEVRHQLESGMGFAIIDRLPIDEIDVDISKKIYWLFMNMIGQTVAQKWDGTLVYDVTDTKVEALAGNGVRSSKTNSGQSYHTDNSFNLPPDYVALFCLQTAREGGMSGLISLETVYNRLLEHHRDVLPRLHQPFYFDRQREHGPKDSLTNSKPVVHYNGRAIAFCLSPRLIQQGYEVVGEEMDAETTDAVHALIDATEQPGLGKSFKFERGQIQIVNNTQLGHRRTAYTDYDEPEKRRHLVRIWIRDRGRPFYFG